MKSVLITGGHGFIGRNLAETLKRAGYIVLAPKSNELNLLDEHAVDAFMEQQHVDVIVHAANKGGGRNTLEMNDVVHMNLRMFFNVVKHADKVDKIIHFGSGAEYGKQHPIVMAEEEDALLSMPLDDYGFYKSVCSRYIEKVNANIVNLRIFACYGKYEDYRYKFISNAIVKNLLGLPINIRQNVLFDYIYVDDLVKMVVWVVENDTKYNVYNVTKGEKVDLLSLAEIINSVSDKPVDIIVDNDGLNLEYTSSNSRIIKEFPVDFTSHSVAIADLYNYYKNNCLHLDCEIVRKDEFIEKIKVNKS
jgi:nucleoside-diphosphate-sugar epimerase